MYYHHCTIFWDTQGGNKKISLDLLVLRTGKLHLQTYLKNAKTRYPISTKLFKGTCCQARELRLSLPCISPFLLSLALSAVECFAVKLARIWVDPLIFTCLEVYILQFSSGRLLGFSFTLTVLRVDPTLTHLWRQPVTGGSFLHAPTLHPLTSMKQKQFLAYHNIFSTESLFQDQNDGNLMVTKSEETLKLMFSTNEHLVSCTPCVLFLYFVFLWINVKRYSCLLCRQHNKDSQVRRNHILPPSRNSNSINMAISATNASKESSAVIMIVLYTERFHHERLVCRKIWSTNS